MSVDQEQAEQKRVVEVIDRYIEGINQSQPDVLASVFTEDGVLMALDAPTIQGTAPLTAFFTEGFGMVSLSATIHYDDVIVSGDYAVVRTHSEVKTTLREPNVSKDEQNREMFILRLSDGAWKIARYMFNKLPA